MDHEGRQFWVVAAERSDAGRFIVHAHDMPAAFWNYKPRFIVTSKSGEIPGKSSLTISAKPGGKLWLGLSH